MESFGPRIFSRKSREKFPICIQGQSVETETAPEGTPMRRGGNFTRHDPGGMRHRQFIQSHCRNRAVRMFYAGSFDPADLKE
jgi:hypothetical protein